MPGFITHYLYGCKSIHAIESKALKEIIRDNKKVCALGLQGPDIFFYYPYSFTCNKKHIGSVMHVYETGNFLRNVAMKVREMSGKEREIGIAYLAGFLGHYSLDTTCHPYVYYFTGYMDKETPYFGKHVDFETDIDAILLKKFNNREVIDFKQYKTVAIDSEQLNVVADILNECCKKTYPYISSSKLLMKHVIVNFKWANSMLKDRNGNKKKIIEMAENAVIGHPMVSPLFMVGNKNVVWDDPLNNCHAQWLNPWNTDIKSNESFEDLIERAMGYYMQLLEKLDEYLVQDTDTNACYDNLEKLIQNNSYHSGLDCSIPS